MRKTWGKTVLLPWDNYVRGYTQFAQVYMNVWWTHRSGVGNLTSLSLYSLPQYPQLFTNVMQYLLGVERRFYTVSTVPITTTTTYIVKKKG